MRKLDKLNYIDRYKVLAVIRGKDTEEMHEQADACIDAGCHILEVSTVVPGADRLIQKLKQEHKDSDILIGAGTIHDREMCRIALMAGADFIASPEFNEEVCRMTNLYRSIYFAGCLTSTEIHSALECGADFIKMFPATAYPPAMIRSLCGFFPDIQLMPAGGISAAKAREYLDAGVALVGYPFGSTREEIKRNYSEFLATAKLET